MRTEINRINLRIAVLQAEIALCEQYLAPLLAEENVGVAAPAEGLPKIANPRNPPARKSKPKAEPPPAPEPEIDELEAALGPDTDEDKGAVESIGEDGVRKVCTELVKKFGIEEGKQKARLVLTKHTKNKSGLIKDIMAGSYKKVYNELKKTL